MLLPIPPFWQTILRYFIAFVVAYGAVFWISLTIWTFRDIRSRTQDIYAQLLATLLVFFFTLGGLIIYLILRPRQTLADAYERQLEEESLLAEMTSRQTCPACHGQVENDYQVCPLCRTAIKETCPSCNHLLEPKWNWCPYCARAIDPTESFSANLPKARER